MRTAPTTGRCGWFRADSVEYRLRARLRARGSLPDIQDHPGRHHWLAPATRVLRGTPSAASRASSLIASSSSTRRLRFRFEPNQLGLRERELPYLVVAAQSDARPGLAGRDPSRVEVEDRPKSGLRLARELDLDRGRAPARRDADEVRPVHALSRTGQTAKLSSPRVTDKQFARPKHLALASCQPRSDPRAPRQVRPSGGRGRR